MRIAMGIHALILSSVVASSLANAQSPLTPAHRPCGVAAVCKVTDNGNEAKVNLINLSVKVEQVINNDTMEIKLFHEAEGATAEQAFARNSEALDKVMKRVDKVAGIKVFTGNRRATPIYVERVVEDPTGSFTTRHPSDKPDIKPVPAEGTIASWRERVDITLQSQDFKLLSTVLTDLSGDMQIDRMTFKVSDQARKAQEGAMLDKALAEFKDKATLTSTAFGASSYGLVNVSVGEVMPSYDNQVGGMQMMAYKASRSVSVPEVAGGESKFNLSVNGSIQLFNEVR
jgi:predicted secreted protein